MASKVTFSSVADTNADTQLIAANEDRVGLWITNTSSAVLYIRLCQTSTQAATATTGHSYRLAATGGQIDLSNFSGRAWKGSVRGIWAANGTGAANITELE